MEKPVKLCSDELSFVISHSISTRPEVVAANYGQPGVEAGLGEVRVIRSAAEAKGESKRPGLPRMHAQILASLTEAHFATGQVYTLTDLGVSQWTLESEFEEWREFRDDLLDPRRATRDDATYEPRPAKGFDLRKRMRVPMRTLLDLLASTRGVAGIEDEFLMNMRESYQYAISAANTVTDRRALNEEFRRMKVGETGNIGPEHAFEMIYDWKLRQSSPYKVKRTVKLPFSLVDRGQLNIADASALLVLQMLVRRPLLARLVSVDLESRALNDDQLVTGGLFPELVPILVMAPNEPVDDSMSHWIEPDQRLLNTYAMNVGSAGVYEFGDVWPKMIGRKLIEMGFDGVAGITISLQRSETEDTKPGPLEVILQLHINELTGYPPDKWMQDEMREIGRALALVLSEFKAFDDLDGYRLREDNRPYYRNSSLRVEFIGASLATYVHFFEIASEFEHYESIQRRRR